MAVRPKNLHNTHVAPSSPHLKPIIICGIIMALSARSELLAPGSPLYDHVLSRSPAALTWGRWLQNALFYFLFGAHAVETAVFTQKLRVHGVSVASAAWWKWVGTCLLGGRFCFLHFNRVVGYG